MLGIQEDLEDKTGEENNQNAFYSPMKLLKNNNENIYYYYYYKRAVSEQ